jgi:hypothetical protein
MSNTSVEEIPFMKKFAFVLALSMVATGLSIASEPEVFLPGPGGNPLGGDRTVLWLDNPDFDANCGSSEVIGAYALETEIANDFILEAPATIRTMAWWGCYWNGFEGPIASSFNLRYYMDEGCIPAADAFLEFIVPNDCHEMLADGGNGSTDFYYYTCDYEVPLDPNLYWFSAQLGDHEFPPQWGRQGADMTQVCDSAFRSAYFSYPNWVPAPDVFGDLYDASQMFDDEADPTATETASWGAIKGLYR